MPCDLVYIVRITRHCLWDKGDVIGGAAQKVSKCRRGVFGKIFKLLLLTITAVMDISSVLVPVRGGEIACLLIKFCPAVYAEDFELLGWQTYTPRKTKGATTNHKVSSGPN